MKRILWVIVFLSMAQIGFADGVQNFNITQVQIGFSLDISGGNMGFSFTGPMNQVSGFGGAACDYCSVDSTFGPGASVNLSVGDIFYEGFGVVKLGGHLYDTETALLFDSSLAAPTITLPAGGSFSITVPATFASVVSGSAGQDPNFINFNLLTPTRGRLTVTFSWDPDLQVYTFSSGSFSATVPEPATITFMVVGLTAIGGVLGRTRRM